MNKIPLDHCGGGVAVSTVKVCGVEHRISNTTKERILELDHERQSKREQTTLPFCLSCLSHTKLVSVPECNSEFFIRANV
jgi:hypothetical protein